MGSAAQQTESFFQPGVDTLKSAAKGGPAFEGISANKIFGGDLATKAGLGRYKAPEIGVDESAFRNQDRSNQRRQDFANQRIDARGRRAQEVQAARLADAERIAAQNLGNAGADVRGRQMGLADALSLQAQGAGPSLAQMQLNQARDQNIATAMALAASQRGQTAGQGLRSIQDQAAQANQFAGAEAARQRVAEQLAAREQLAGVLGTTRGMDIDMASENARLAQQASMANQAAQNEFALQQAQLQQNAALANQQADLRMTGLNDAYIQALNQQMMGMDMADQNRLMDLEKLKADIALGRARAEAGGFEGHQQRTGDFISKLGQAGASMYSGGGA